MRSLVLPLAPRRTTVLLSLASLALGACGGVAGPTDAQSDARLDGARADAALDAPSADGGLDSSSGTDAAPTDAPTDAPAVDAAPEPPLPTPIRYLVVVMKENHTFDNLFFNFPGVSSPPPATARRSTGATITLASATLPFTQLRAQSDATMTADPVHTHYQALNSFHGGAMDSFDQPDHPTVGTLPFYHYPEAQLPNYWAYAREFVLCDDFFTTNLGPSLPGHLTMMAAYSPVFDNESCPDGATCPSDMCDPTTAATITSRFDNRTCAITATAAKPCFDVPTVVDNLPANLTWRVYGTSSLRYIKSIHDTHALATHQHAMSALLADLQRGNMANLTLLDGGWPSGQSEHPPAHPCAGENVTVDIVNAIIEGGHWNETAIVVTYDDWGGWYDHVRPATPACGSATNGPFNEGFRVPTLIISPYARRGAGGAGLVFHGHTEQASIPRLVAELLRDPAHDPVFLQSTNAHARDQSAGSLLPAFDFTQPPRPPLRLTPRTNCP